MLKNKAPGQRTRGNEVKTMSTKKTNKEIEALMLRLAKSEAINASLEQEKVESSAKIAELQQHRKTRKAQLLMCVSEKSDSEMHMSVNESVGIAMKQNPAFMQDFSISCKHETEVTSKKLNLEVLRVKKDATRAYFWAAMKKAIADYKSVVVSAVE